MSDYSKSSSPTYRIVRGCLIFYIAIVSLFLAFVAIPQLRALMFDLVVAILGIEESATSYYASSDILRTCELLNFEESDGFCSSLENQFPQSFSEALERNYPLGTTHYDEFVGLLEEIPSTHTCESIEDYLQEFPDNCPPPNQCNQNYECYFSLPGMGSLQILIANSSGRIINFAPERYSDSD